jgi:hypothetical protein|tara:strand:+ start:316 stop:555 length:240 start_codon:yes stop_codon:yes gene_type:complete
MIVLNDHIFNEHCRFKLKSGKEIYGIIWQVNIEDEPAYFFTSASQKEKIEASENRLEMIKELGFELDINEVLMSENLAS